MGVPGAEGGKVADPVLSSDSGCRNSSICGCDALLPTNAAEGAVGCCRRRKKKIATTAMETAATPPTTPPTMAPVFELLFDEDDE
jgi:hypothetical protein